MARSGQADGTWRPALPAGFASERGPEGIVIVPGPATAQRQTEWLVTSGTGTVCERLPGSEPSVIFAGIAAELTATPGKGDEDDELICQPSCSARTCGRRYLLLRSHNDPTVPRELGLWLASNAQITLDDQITQ
jgi:hypothetical protein